MYYLLTPWCRVLLEKLTGLQLVKKFPAFHKTRRFITALTSARQLYLSWTSPIQSIYPHPTSCRSILILSTHLRLGLPSGLLPSGFPTKTLCTPLSSSIHATCPAHLVLLHFITHTILGEEYKSCVGLITENIYVIYFHISGISFGWSMWVYLISNFHRVLNVVCFLLGRYPPHPVSVPVPAPTLSPSFRLAQVIFEPNLFLYKYHNTSQTQSFLTPTRLWNGTDKTSAHKIQTPGNYPEERIQQLWV